MKLGNIRRLRKFLPISIEYKLRDAFYTVLPVKHISYYTNIFHCCVWKTASQWVRLVFSDPRIFQYSGLRPTVPIDDKTIPLNLCFAKRRIITPLYCDYKEFQALRKPVNYRVFFVVRDPRDILVSWYFSNRYSHPLTESIAAVRHNLEKLSEKDGLSYTLKQFGEIASMLRSWGEAAQTNEEIKLVKYEHLTQGNILPAWTRLLNYCDIQIPENILKRILETYRFESISGGRPKGKESKTDKYRKGISGDWQNHFDSHLESRFNEINGDILMLFKYEPN